MCSIHMFKNLFVKLSDNQFDNWHTQWRTLLEKLVKQDTTLKNVEDQTWQIRKENFPKFWYQTIFYLCQTSEKRKYKIQNGQMYKENWQ